MNNESRQRLLTWVALICVGALVGDRLIFTPLMNLWTERSEKIALLEKSLAKGTLLLEREEDLIQRWDEMRKNSLPPDNSLAENQVLKAWDRWVKESGITPTTFKPQWRQEEEYLTYSCRAVAQGNLFFIPPDQIQRHTPRILDGAERLCGQLDEAQARR